jgi:hypothetical protein
MVKSLLLCALTYLQVLSVSLNVLELRAGVSTQAKEATPPLGTVHVVTIRATNDVIDSVSAGGTSTLRSAEDTITWVNNTGSPIYVCFPDIAKPSPFHPIVWYVPAGKKRKSGEINIFEKTSVQYNVDPNSVTCMKPRPGEGNPPIIVLQP